MTRTNLNAINILRVILHTKFYNNIIFTEKLKNITELESFNSAYISNSHTVQIKIKKTYLKKKYNMELNDTYIYYEIFSEHLLNLLLDNYYDIETMYNTYNSNTPLGDLLNKDTLKFLFNVTVMSENIINFHL